MIWRPRDSQGSFNSIAIATSSLEFLKSGRFSRSSHLFSPCHPKTGNCYSFLTFFYEAMTTVSAKFRQKIDPPRTIDGADDAPARAARRRSRYPALMASASMRQLAHDARALLPSTLRVAKPGHTEEALRIEAWSPSVSGVVCGAYHPGWISPTGIAPTVARETFRLKPLPPSSR
jgi:hypothetical protein